MKRKKILAVASVAGLGVLISLFLPSAQSNHRPVNYLVSAHRSDFEVKIATVGSLDTAHAYHLLSKIRGDRGKIIRIAEDGARVEKGDIVVAFDPTYFETEGSRLMGQIKSFASMVDYANQMLLLAKSEGEKTVSNEQQELFAAKQDYERYQTYIHELQELQAKGYNIASEIVQAKRKSDQALAKVEKSKTDVARLRREAGFKNAQVMADVNKVKSEYETLQKTMDEIKLDHENSILRAPTSGFVVINDNPQGEPRRKLRVGDTVWQGQSIFYIPDTSSMVLETQVREVDLHKIAPQQEAVIKIDAYPDVAFSGQVENIGAMATENPGSPEKYFHFTVKLKGEDPRLRPGMTARVFITVSRVQNALTIPLTGLFTESGKTHCFVHDGYQFQDRPVTVGQMNEEVAQITTGLNEGESVSLVRP